MIPLYPLCPKGGGYNPDGGIDGGQHRQEFATTPGLGEGEGLGLYCASDVGGEIAPIVERETYSPSRDILV